MVVMIVCTTVVMVMTTVCWSVARMAIVSMDVTIMTANRTMIVDNMVVPIAGRLGMGMVTVWFLVTMIKWIVITYLKSCMPMMTIPMVRSTMRTIIMWMMKVATMMVMIVRSSMVVRSTMMVWPCRMMMVWRCIVKVLALNMVW